MTRYIRQALQAGHAVQTEQAGDMCDRTSRTCKTDKTDRTCSPSSPAGPVCSASLCMSCLSCMSCTSCLSFLSLMSRLFCQFCLSCLSCLSCLFFLIQSLGGLCSTTIPINKVLIAKHIKCINAKTRGLWFHLYGTWKVKYYLTPTPLIWIFNKLALQCCRRAHLLKQCLSMRIRIQEASE